MSNSFGVRLTSAPPMTTLLLLGLISSSPIRIPSGGTSEGASASPDALSSREVTSPLSISRMPESRSSAQSLFGGSFISFSSSHSSRTESIGIKPIFFFTMDSSFQINS